jgi:hypothetical protein
MIKLNLILFTLLILISQRGFTQVDFDITDYRSLGIIIVNSDSGKLSSIKVQEIKNSGDAELIFGINHRTRKYYNTLFDGNFIDLYYPDGLNLSIDDDHKVFFSFEINGAKYALRFQDGKIIQVGMNERALKEIFPLSFSNKTTITDNVRNHGKTLVRVYLSVYALDKMVVTDESVVFLIGSDGIIENIKISVPG